MKKRIRRKTTQGNKVRRIPTEIIRAANMISLKEGCNLTEAYRRLAMRSKRYNIW